MFLLLFLVPAASQQSSPNTNILRFVDDASFAYVDFARRGETPSVSTFRAEDYKWEEQGFPLVNRLYSDIGSLLEDKFKMAADLTYYT